MDLVINKARVLVVVKAYPNPSKTYEETVCTAGLLDGERWVRIYPVSYRFLQDDKKYPKYGWIELDLQRREKDFRPESHRPLRGIQEDIMLIDSIPATPDGWMERRKYILQNVYTSMTDLITAAYADSPISIGVLKPSEILDAVVEADEREWPKDPAEVSAGPSLFSPHEGGLDVNRKRVKKVPFKFSYRFTTDDGKDRTLMIEDWEIGALYWNCLRDALGDEKIAVQKVKQKCLWLAGRDRDLHFILGTTLKYHSQSAPNPFVIIGLFYPPRRDQYTLF